jgi:hypothetical protein
MAVLISRYCSFNQQKNVVGNGYSAWLHQVQGEAEALPDRQRSQVDILAHVDESFFCMMLRKA